MPDRTGVAHIAAVVLAATGCSAAAMPPPIANERVLRGVHVTAHVDPAARDTVCPGDVAALDGFVAAAAAYLSVPAPQADYFLYARADRVGCPTGSDACAHCETATARAVAWTVGYHELVHLVACPLGRAPPFLEEGLAVALSAVPAPRAEAPDGPARLEDNLAADAWRARSGDEVWALYVAAGAFVRYLFDRFGRAAVVAFYRDLGYRADVPTIAARAAAALGVPLERALADWRADRSARGREHPPTLGPLACFAPALAASAPGAFALAARAPDGACGPPGARFDEAHTVTLDAPGVYGLRAETTGSLFVAALTACAGGDGAPLHALVTSAAPATTLVALPAGRFALTTGLDAADPRGGLVVAPDGALRRQWNLARLGPVGARCDDAVAVRRDAASGPIRYAVRPNAWARTSGEVVASWLRIAYPSARSVWVGGGFSRGSNAASGPGVRVRLCTGACDAMTACQTIELTPNGPTALAYRVADGDLLVELLAPGDLTALVVSFDDT